MIARKFGKFYQTNDNFAVIPIPLHFKKEHERGFNQALLLAQEFSKQTKIPIETNILQKVRETKTQVETENKESRTNNLEDAFRADAKVSENIKNKTIILIDDVSTTGATLVHAADALTKAGAKNIIGLVVAHG